MPRKQCLGVLCRQMLREKVLFMHIPKTAGTSLGLILNRHYRSRLARVYDPVQVREGMNPGNALACLGHFRFGFHQKIGWDSGASYVAFIREPDQHAWSHFHYLKKQSKVDASTSFSDFLNQAYGYNLQLRFISGVEDIKGREESVLADCLEKLDQNYLSIAPTERFDEALLLLRPLLGWKSPSVYHRLNEQKGKPEMSDSERAECRRILAPEWVLYREIQSRFENRWNKSSGQKWRLGVFRLCLAVYEKLDPTYVKLKRFFAS